MAQWLAGGLYSGVRADGRGSLDFRVRVCQTGFFLHVNGSSRVTVAPLGGASHRVDVLCTVCAEAGEPEADAPGRGRMEFSVTIADRSDATMGKFARQNLEAELSQAVSRSFASVPGAEGICDSLLLLKGQYCWVLKVDMLVEKCGGRACRCMCHGGARCTSGLLPSGCQSSGRAEWSQGTHPLR